MAGFELYFDIITLFCGAYALYTAFKLRQQGQLFPNQLLIPKDQKPEHCLDEEGYIAYILPKLIIFGMLLVVVGGYSLADSRFHISEMLLPQISNIEFYITEAGVVLSILALVWYMACWTKARKNYWA